MSECGCLDEKKKALLIQVLDTHAQVIEDQSIVSIIKEIKKEVETCTCSTKKGSSGDKPKKAQSAYNVHTSQCMKGGGKTMKECAVEWKANKNKKGAV